MTNAGDLVAWLRAAGEPTRLRLLALCAERDFSVSELALAVGQSGPRTSRHLKILSGSGLLTRFRRGQWVHYRLAQDPQAARFLRALVEDLDPADPLLAPDRKRARVAGSAPDPDARSRLDQALASFVSAGSETGGARRGSSLVVGAQQHAMLASVIRTAADCTAIAHSQRASRAAGVFLRREGLRCRLISAGAQELIPAEVARAHARFAAVVLNRATPHTAPLDAWLAAARPLLAPEGRLWLFERQESLGNLQQPSATAAIARLRQLLDAGGFACERLSPIHAGREVVLAAVAVPASMVRAASVA
ncbi:MAG TPA: metalloregulator ArsR/SmtB family transcription factor [Steroidobacteraceae bacterium]